MARRLHKPGRPPSLIEAIQQVADCPCPAHQQAFLDALSDSDELLFEAVGGRSPHPDADLQLTNVEAENQTFLLAFPDLDAARRHDPSATIVGISRDEAFRMVLADASVDGILIIAGTDNDAWAAAPRDALRTLLSG